MPSPEQDIKFLKEQLKKYLGYKRNWEFANKHLSREDLTPIETTSNDDKRIACLAEKYGFDASLYWNLYNNDDPFSNESIARLSKQIETITRIITQINIADQEKAAIPDDLISLTKAITVVCISRSQIKRDIDAGKINTYRKNPKGNHKVSLSEIKKKYLVRV